jgi:polar amino acid transport system substrate-binding protein
VFSGKVYDQAMKRGVVRFGVPYNRAPQGFFDANGKLVGFEVDLASEIARRMNLKIETAKVNEKTWGPMLSGGQIDAAVCGVKHTRSLESQFDFSIPYFFDAPHILVMKGQFKVPSDLNGHKIAAVQGAPFEKDAMQILRDSGDKMAEKNVVSYPDRPSCFLALGREKVAGWIDSGMILLEYGAKNPARFALISAGDAVEPVAVALPQDDSAWRDLVNFTIQDLAADGALKTLYDKWFGPDTPHAFPMKRTIEIWPE